jgi:hypothetical protein
VSLAKAAREHSGVNWPTADSGVSLAKAAREHSGVSLLMADSGVRLLTAAREHWEGSALRWSRPSHRCSTTR